MTRTSARSEMNESEVAALLLKAQEEERLGQVIHCDDAEAVRELFADIHAHHCDVGGRLHDHGSL